MRTTVLRVDARNSQLASVGTANTFFLTENASADHVTATFWIETVKKPHSQRALPAAAVHPDRDARLQRPALAARLRGDPAQAGHGGARPATTLPTAKGAKAGRETELT